MVSAYRFDAEQSERVEEWAAASKHVDSAELLWLALREPSDDEMADLAGALELGEERVPLLRDPAERAG